MRYASLLAGSGLLLLAALGPAAAFDLPEPLTAGGTALVVEVIDGDTVRLDDGRQVRLVGTQAPKLPLGRANFPTWPLAEESKQALEALVLGQQVVLGYGGLQTDRHGRTLAHLFRIDDGSWAQGHMLLDGMARVYTFPDNRSMIDEMLAAERGARAEGIGIWSLDFYAIRGPEDLADDEDTFQVVEGVVQEAAFVRNRVYLNFGADYRTDFTVVIDRDDLPAFEAADYQLEDLTGRQVRVRGWVEFYNGPMIAATHPEQIELR